MHKGDCSFCTKLVKKELFDISGLAFPEGELNEDFHLLVQLLTWLEKGIVSLPQQTYHVFYRIGSNSRKADKESFSRVYADCVDNADMVEVLVAQSIPTLKSKYPRFNFKFNFLIEQLCIFSSSEYALLNFKELGGVALITESLPENKLCNALRSFFASFDKLSVFLTNNIVSSCF